MGGSRGRVSNETAGHLRRRPQIDRPASRVPRLAVVIAFPPVTLTGQLSGCLCGTDVELRLLSRPRRTPRVECSVEVPTGRPAVGAGELLDVRAGHVVIAERVDMHNTSF